MKNLMRYDNKWKNLKTIIRVQSTREFKNFDKPIEKVTRYYTSSLEEKSEFFQKAVRSHSVIENKLHWSLDVTFSEVQSRKRTQNAAQNFSILIKIALNLLKKRHES